MSGFPLDAGVDVLPGVLVSLNIFHSGLGYCHAILKLLSIFLRSLFGKLVYLLFDVPV